MRVVVTLTTMPDKYRNSDKLLVSLKSLNNQTYKLDEIYLGLPYRCERLNIDYPEVSDEIKKLCKIIRCPDYGPITKILPALLNEEDPSTIIITVDDDLDYNKNLVEKLIEKHKLYPNSAIGSSGMLLKNLCPNCSIYPSGKNIMYNFTKFNVPKNGRKVDAIYGYSGALYLRSFFPIKDKVYDEFIKTSISDENLKINDDIGISGYLSINNIERRIFPDFSGVNLSYNKNPTEISYNVYKFFTKLNLSIIKAKSLGMYKNIEDIYYIDTLSFKIILLLLLLIILLITIFLFIYI